ncbi:acetyl-CoA C-acetyltransferase [Nitrosomonas aestuarii]|uniref:acetyl-CoA C-acetyltransferase n=1 Tax=Nitrosomonas aestuarii TaxID=52441 RepID=UPI000D30D9DE|nr:acetyl-CoA C-acetyltransferase [Nitrosomonas aestuarii]PTN10313.1 acetyl-CoA C-acetyltransferase [Nitrosomonas aestuarii]
MNETLTQNGNSSSATESRPVYIIDGARTPFIKARGKPGPFTPVDLAVQCGRSLLLRQPFRASDFDQVILGCVNVISKEMNPARIAALRLGMGVDMPAFTVQINCGSGMQSIDTAYKYIRSGESNLILAGGAEALSHAPLFFGQEAVAWFASLSRGALIDKIKKMFRFNPKYFKPEISLKHGLTDPIVDMNMGQTAEKLAYLFNITREQADQYAVSSHKRLHRAQQENFLANEVEPLFSRYGQLYENDDGVRPDSSLEKLAKLSPAFEPPYGKITAGNSSQITDGASWVILASEEAVKQYKLEPRAAIKDSEWSALDPSIMGLGPVLSSTAIMKRHNLSLDHIDLWEINEAFAAQVLACLKAWNDVEFCKNVLGLEQSMGEMDRDKLNVDGGAISMGHPVGTSGNRIVLHLMNAMHRLDKKQGIATECIGGGQAGAMLIERV